MHAAHARVHAHGVLQSTTPPSIPENLLAGAAGPGQGSTTESLSQSMLECANPVVSELHRMLAAAQRVALQREYAQIQAALTGQPSAVTAAARSGVTIARRPLRPATDGTVKATSQQRQSLRGVPVAARSYNVAHVGVELQSLNGRQTREDNGEIKELTTPTAQAVAVGPSELEGLVLTHALGEGRHGSVYLGTWRGLAVAVKRLLLQVNSHLGGSLSMQNEGLREAAIAMSLNHSNLVATYTYGLLPLQPAVAQGLDWQLMLVQEYCQGGSLRSAIESRWLLGQAETLDLALLLQCCVDICLGMAHLHARNLVHGDLKPENILLQLVPSSHPQVSEPVVVLKVCDFGLSSRLHPDQSHISNVRHGTFLYMAPELLRSGRASKASDVFSFGITAWELGYQRSAWKHYLAAREASHGDGRAPHMLFNFTLPLRGGEDPAAQHPDTVGEVEAAFADLAARCLSAEPEARPSFKQLSEHLLSLLMRVESM
ncbi:kinase-like domain-containing protein [Haematococcus lacustris]